MMGGDGRERMKQMKEKARLCEKQQRLAKLNGARPMSGGAEARREAEGGRKSRENEFAPRQTGAALDPQYSVAAMRAQVGDGDDAVEVLMMPIIMPPRSMNASRFRSKTETHKHEKEEKQPEKPPGSPTKEKGGSSSNSSIGLGFAAKEEQKEERPPEESCLSGECFGAIQICGNTSIVVRELAKNGTKSTVYTYENEAIAKTIARSFARILPIVRANERRERKAELARLEQAAFRSQSALFKGLLGRAGGSGIRTSYTQKAFAPSVEQLFVQARGLRSTYRPRRAISSRWRQRRRARIGSAPCFCRSEEPRWRRNWWRWSE